MQALIIEDNEIEAENLKVILDSFDKFESVGAVNTLEQGMKTANKNRPRLIFLDIQMEYENSLEHLHQLQYQPYIVCCTLHSEYALKAYEVGIHGYLTKPITHEKVVKVISQFSKLNRAVLEEVTEQTVTFKKGGASCIIPIKEITQICADGDYSEVKDQQGSEFLSTRRMSEWREQLPDTFFVSLDRSTIVNRSLISSFSNLTPERTAKVTFNNGSTCQIGAAGLKRLKAAMEG